MRATILATALLGSLLASDKPNVLLIVCDDLNDYVETLGGHPQVKTPNIKRLIESGVSFQQAHCNIPICNPSRASFLTGLYPHTSQLFGFDHWDKNNVLKNSHTMMTYFRANGYHALGTGKVMHSRDSKEWSEYGHPSDYGPFAYDGEDNLPHPETPSPLRDDFGQIDGSFGPLYKLPTDSPYQWRTGGWNKQRIFRYETENDRDPTGDELNAEWAIEKLKNFAKNPTEKPFFMGVGFVRPHTPLIVPKSYFDLYPVGSVELPEILENDVEDTFKHSLTGNEDDRGGDRGAKIHDSLVASFGGDRELALRKFIQAYLASITSVDDLVGEILEVVDNSSLRENTIIIFTSDHGWGNGEKGSVYKNTLWQESTRVPLVIRAPGVSIEAGKNETPVSLIDIFPTLIDLCELKGDTAKSAEGRELDGHSLVPLLSNPKSDDWDGPDAALTALYKWAQYYDPAKQSYSLRYKDWRYIRYENGKEELYHTAKDPHEWTNLALKESHKEQLSRCRQDLLRRIPSSIPIPKQSNDQWKENYFKKHPEADTNQDATLSWAELNAHKKKPDAEKWKDRYFMKNPEADTNQDGQLSWPEYKAHKSSASE